MKTPWAWITRELDRGGKLADRLGHYGITSIRTPTIQCTALPINEVEHQMLRASYDWILFTSVNGVKFFSDVMKGAPLSYANSQMVGIGAATRMAIKDLLGVPSTVLDSVSTGDELGNVLENVGIAEKHILIPGPKERASSLNALLRQAGAEVVDINLYETLPRILSHDEKASLKTMNPEDGIVIFFSPSAVTGFCASMTDSWLDTKSIAAFGASTSKALRERGFAPSVESGQIDGKLPREEEFADSIAHFLLNR